SAGDPADRARPRQLSRRAVQGDPSPFGHRRPGTDADGKDPGVPELPLYRADHARGRLLPRHEPRRRSPDPAGGDMAEPQSAQPRRRPMTTPMVKFDNVTKRYGALTVLDSLNLEIAPNEKVAIIGPSGSGKTTVLRMLMTLERINDGVIYVDGEPLTHM